MVESLRETDSGVAVIEEDATRDRVLREAGIERAREPPGHIDQATVGPDSKVEGLTSEASDDLIVLGDYDQVEGLRAYIA